MTAMTAHQLADLNGLLALEAARRYERGDRRDKSAIVDAILAEGQAPPIVALLNRIAAMYAAPLARKLPA